MFTVNAKAQVNDDLCAVLGLRHRRINVFYIYKLDILILHVITLIHVEMQEGLKATHAVAMASSDAPRNNACLEKDVEWQEMYQRSDRARYGFLQNRVYPRVLRCGKGKSVEAVVVQP